MQRSKQAMSTTSTSGTTYQAGPRSFDSLDQAIEYARRCDFGTVAILIDGVITSEHDIQDTPVTSGLLVCNHTSATSTSTPGQTTGRTYWNDTARIAVELARASIVLASAVESIHTIERVNPNLWLYPGNVDTADSILSGAPDVIHAMRQLAGVMDREAMYKAQVELEHERA
jgi:hypothetical protein